MSDTPISAMKWKIVDNDKAKELHLTEVTGALVIDVKDIPKGMSLQEYIMFLQESNIIIKDNGVCSVIG